MPTYGFEGLRVALDDLTNWQRETSAARRIDEHAQSVVDRARAKIGEYQPAVAEWPAWEALAASTVEHKQKMGAGDDQPLLGVDHANHMRDDITYRVTTDALSVYAEVGIPDGAPSADYAMAQELGRTDNSIPERPFLGPSLYEEGDGFHKEIEGVIANWGRRAALRQSVRDALAG